MLHQHHLPPGSSTTIKQLLTPNLSRARQNWTISVEITPKVHKVRLKDISHKLWEKPILLDFSLRRNFPEGHGNRVSRFSEMRLPCISKSHKHLSTNSLPKLKRHPGWMWHCERKVQKVGWFADLEFHLFCVLVTSASCNIVQ